MKIVYFAAYFYPEKYSSNIIYTSLFTYFAEKNEVNVITPRATRGVSKGEYKNFIRYEKKDNINIYRFNAPKENKNFFLRYIRYCFCNNKYKKYKKLLKDCDLFFCGSTPPTLAKVVGKLAKKYNKPFIYNVQDVFPDSLVTTKILKRPKGLIWNYAMKLQNPVYNLSDKIVVISSDMKNNLISKGVDGGKISLIYNSIDSNKYYKIKKEDNCLFDELGLDRNKTYITYAGSLGNAQNIDIILDSAKLLTEFSDLYFIIIGNGVKSKNIQKRITNEKIQNVLLFPLQSISKINEVYSLGIASIVTCCNGVGTSAMPSKTWSILATETPVLANYDEGTELEKIICDNNIGLFTKSNDIISFVENVKFIYNNKEKMLVMGKNGRKFIEENISSEMCFNKYKELIENICSGENKNEYI